MSLNLSLEEILRKVGNVDSNSLTVIGIGTGIGLFGYIIGRIHQRIVSEKDGQNAHHPYHTLETSSLNQHASYPSNFAEIDHEDDYNDSTTTRQIADAVKATDNSRVNGIVQECHSHNGSYSGIIFDSSGSVPFCFSEEDINSFEEEGLIPLLLKNSQETNRTIEFAVHKHDELHLLIVEGLRYQMDDVVYKIN